VSRRLVIAIDGPSGAGKSTAGRALAQKLGYVFLDTGAMYRALALQAVRNGAHVDDEAELVRLLERTRIELEPGGRKVLLDGDDVTAEIRTREVTTAASKISVHPRVRRNLVARQRQMGAEGGVVMDGRDIGTHVFPDAHVKFYLDADPRHRAERRYAELRAAGAEASVDAIEKEIRDRDLADTTRADSPLTRAHDAIHVDTTTHAAAEVVEMMLKIVREKQAAG
jgi:cytidylate kinase